MGELAALAARGMPPTGRGVWLRNLPLEAQDVGAGFVAVNAARSDYLEQVEAVGGAWLYTLIHSWRPDTWRVGLQQILQARRAALAAGLFVHGIIADPEGGWPDLSAVELEDEATQLGQSLAALAGDMRVGLSTYPHWPGRDPLIAAAGDALWYSPQLYGRTSQDPAAIDGWYRLWTSRVGPQHCIPTIAGWVASPLHSTAQGYRDYLEMLPAAGGVMVFLGAGQVPEHIATALRSYQPGGSMLGTLALGARNALLRPAAIAVAVAILALIGLLLVGMRLAKRSA